MLRKFLRFLLCPFEFVGALTLAFLSEMWKHTFEPNEVSAAERVNSAAIKRTRESVRERAQILAFLKSRAAGECDLELLTGVKSVDMRTWAVMLPKSELEHITSLSTESALAAIGARARKPRLAERVRAREREQETAPRGTVRDEFAVALDLVPAPRPSM